MAGDVVTVTCGGRDPAEGDAASPTATGRRRVDQPRPRPQRGNDYALVFHVADRRIDAVSEYCDTSYMKRILFDQLPGQDTR